MTTFVAFVSAAMDNRLFHNILSGLLFLLISIAATAEMDTVTVRTELLTVQDGLSQGLISSIIQDKEGLMWFGTKDGLNKYDGYHFTVYRNEAGNPYSLPGNYVTAMVEDDLGNFWIATLHNGLCLFDKKRERFYPVRVKPDPATLSGNPIDVLKYSEGKLLVRDNRTVIYDVSHIRPGNYANVDLGKTKICFNEQTSLPAGLKPFRKIWDSSANDIQVLSWMDDNSLWCCARDSILVYSPDHSGIFRKTKTLSLSGTGISPNLRYEVFADSGYHLLLSNRDLVLYDFAQQHLITKISFNDNYRFERKLSKDKWGNYFVIGEDRQYYFNVIDHSLKVVKGRIGDGYLDRSDIQWIYTAGDGIIKYDYRRQLFHPIERAKLLAFRQTSRGMVVEEKYEGLYLVNLENNKRTPILTGGNWNAQWKLKEAEADRRGTHYVLYETRRPLQFCLRSCEFATGKMRTRDLTSAFDFLYACRLMIDRKDQLWMGGFDKAYQPILVRLNKYDLSTEAVYRFPAKKHNIHSHFVYSFYQDEQGIFWFATTQGLFRFDERRNSWMHWKNIPTDTSSLSSNELLSILPDPGQPGKFLWIGTEGAGLNRFEIATGKCMRYTDKNGLPNNVVYGLLSDKAGNIWMSTNNGLSCFDPSNRTFRNFAAEDGLPGNEFNRNEYVKLTSGNLFFGGVAGSVSFDPAKVLEKSEPPEVILTGLSVYNKPVDYETDSSIIRQPLTYADRIVLTHDKNMFTISFAALEFRSPKKKQYKYFLEGYDKGWISSGNKNEATYTNLPPGDYVFHVTAAGYDNTWNQKGVSIRLSILPAWYQTWWFRMLTIAAIAGLVYAFYRYRLQQVLRLQFIRNNIASDLHDEIGSTLSSISLSSAVIKKKLDTDSSGVKALLDQIETNTDNMMEAMSDIVWAVNTNNDSFESVVNRMRAFAIQILEPKDILLHMNAGKHLSHGTFDMRQRKNLYLIFKEAINNSAKYSDSKNVWVEIEKQSDSIVMSITDDGSGFDILKRDPEIMGGNGINNMQTRAREMKGKLLLESFPGKGTSIRLSFPV